MLTERFNHKIQNLSHKKNVVKKTYIRMINKANDLNQSSFSLNNIVFLAFMGLVSMCS